MTSSLSNGLDLASDKTFLHASGTNGNSQSDSSVELILTANPDTLFRATSHSRETPTNIISPAMSVNFGNSDYANCIVIAPDADDDSHQAAALYSTSNKYDNGYMMSHSDFVMGFGGYYTCHGHSVESMMSPQNAVDVPVANMPLDLSHPSKRIHNCNNDGLFSPASDSVSNAVQNGSLDLSIHSMAKVSDVCKTISGISRSNSHMSLPDADYPNLSLESSLNGSATEDLGSAHRKRQGHADTMQLDDVSRDSNSGSSTASSSVKTSAAVVTHGYKRRRLSAAAAKSKREEPSQCSYCSKWFCSSWSRISHERTHTGQNRHYCKVCHRSFPTPHEHNKIRQASYSSAAAAAATADDDAQGNNNNTDASCTGNNSFVSAPRKNAKNALKKSSSKSRAATTYDNSVTSLLTNDSTAATTAANDSST